ncbi:hypothetical protein DL96DRAFT_1627891, partial [Flagelloscypha sp. PMI_526]
MAQSKFSVEDERRYRKHNHSAGFWSVHTDGHRHGSQPVADDTLPQSARIPIISPYRARSKSIHGDSSSHGHLRQHSRSTQPDVGPSESLGSVLTWQDISIDQLTTPLATITTSPPTCQPLQRSFPHSEQVVLFPASNIPPVPPIAQRPGGRQKSAPVPTVIPPGYPEGTAWVVDSGGQPRLETPAQYRVRYNVQTSDSILPKQGHDQYPQPFNDIPPQTPGRSEGSFQRPRSKSIHEPSTSRDEARRRSRSRQPVVPPPGFPGPVIDWRDIPRDRINFPFATVPTPPPSEPPRRSRSHSRSGVAPDSSADPVPFVVPRPRRQPKPAPIPSVIPPGYPEGTTWVVKSNGRPQLETPEQYLARYGTQSPASIQAAQINQQTVSHATSRHAPQPHYPQTQFQSHPMEPARTPQPQLDSSQTPVATSSQLHTPFLKRIFHGIVSRNTNARGVVPVPRSPADPISPTSQRLSRTKSM